MSDGPDCTCNPDEGEICANCAAPLPAVDDELVERLADDENVRRAASSFLDANAAQRGLHSEQITRLVQMVFPAVLAIAGPHYEQRGWEKGREQAAQIMEKWSAYPGYSSDAAAAIRASKETP